MRYNGRKMTAAARHMVWAIGSAAAAWALLTVGGAAQQTSNARLNRLIAQFEQDEAAIGNEHWRTISFEHNPFMVDDLERFLDEFKTDGTERLPTPIVRIHHEADQEFHHVVKQLLDAGAFGIVLPQVRHPEQVTKLIRAMRYPPQRGAEYPEPRGRRAWGPTAATRVWDMSADEYARHADVWPLNPEGELLAIIMCETRECVENIDEILQVPGLGAVMIGSADLSLALGVGTPAANPGAPEVEAAVKTVAEACMRHNVPCGIGTRSSLSTSPSRILAGLGRD